MKKLLIMLLVTFSVVTAGAWVIETVDSGDNYRSNPSLVFDSLDHPYISYAGIADLRFARWDGIAWQIEILDDLMRYAGDTSLVLDSEGNPHIAYSILTSDGTDYLKYAQWDGTTWLIETVLAPNYGCFVSLALDSTDKPHIAYLTGHGMHQLGYAAWDGSAWVFEVIDSAGYAAGNCSKPSLALDSTDNPHISYFDCLEWWDRDIKYAYRDDSVWYTELILRTTSHTVDTCLALTASDTPSIIAAHIGLSSYHYIVDDHWESDDPLIISNSSTPSLALDSLNNPHVACRCTNGEDHLSYAHKVDSSWL